MIKERGNEGITGRAHQSTETAGGGGGVGSGSRVGPVAVDGVANNEGADVCSGGSYEDFPTLPKPRPEG